ncbi:MAG: efflux RND transporter permease subunit, partial [Rhodospirillales bacterium]
MILSDISIKRPVLATVVSLLIVVLGIGSLLGLAVREYPNIDPPVVSVTTTYTGAAPEIVDTEVTEVIESAISAVDGVRYMTSESRDGRGETTVEFILSRDVDNAANDVRDAIGRIQSRLPEEADAPVVRKADADARPMMWLPLTSNRMSPQEMTDFAERFLVDRLSVLEGVARIRIGGERRFAMRIWLDREAMAARDVTAEDVEAALRRGNVELPAGRLESVTRELTVRTDSRLREPEEFQRLLIRRDGIYKVLLGDVARVERGVEDKRSILRADGQEAIGLGIIRQSQANIIAVSDLVRAEVAAIAESLPEGLEIAVNYDEAVFVREAVKEVVRALGIAVGLVILVIFVFLRTVRATLVPAFTIPVSIIGAFTVMAAMGFSINVLTLLALILAVGLVVDDAIVMVENVQRRIDEGEPPLLAAYNGARQVAFAIIATTLALIAVFVPISFMQGNVGRLFTEFGFVLAAAVAFSSVVALTLAPMLCSKWLKPLRSGSPLLNMTERWFHGLAAGYRWLLERALKAPIVVLTGALIAAGTSFQLFQMLPQELAPTEDRGVFIVPSRAPEGTTPEHTFRGVEDVEAVLRPFRDETGDVERIFSIVGWGGVGNRGFTIVRLKDWSERDRRQQDIVDEVFPGLQQIPGVRAFAINPPGLGQSAFRQPVQFVIGAPDYDSVRTYRDRILERAGENPGLVNLDSDYQETRPQLLVRIDRARAADLGISVDQIARTLQTMIASREVGTYIDRGREYDVVVQARPEDRISPSNLENIFIRSGSGILIPLTSLVTTEEVGSPPRLSRVDRLPSVTITASLAPGYDLGSALTYFERIAAEELPAQSRITYLGQSLEFKETSAAIYLTFALALVIVFLVLAAQFESFIHPLVIMLAVPLAVTGGLGALLLTGNSLNIYSQIGMI